jgi:methylated-DNA-protein-cysteine methyltransferase related protein
LIQDIASYFSGKILKKKNRDFFEKVFRVTAQIPYGKVTTYGHIAKICGTGAAARTVGWALNSAKNSNLPCHRVVNRFGALTGRLHFENPDLMKDLLESEGIELDENGCVILSKHLWIPQPLKD